MSERTPRHWPGSGDHVDTRTYRDAATRANHVASYLDGSLDSETIRAVRDVWAMLEQAAASSPSHARAVRERMLWESLDAAA